MVLLDLTYRQGELKDIDIQVLLALGHPHWQGTANTSEGGQNSESGEKHYGNVANDLGTG